MSRYIDADAVKVRYRGGFHDDYVVDYDSFMKAPSIEIPTWIPCSERLPSKGVAVLVNGTMYDAPPITISTDAPYYYEQGWINAWMPLPEPWKGKDND